MLSWHLSHFVASFTLLGSISNLAECFCSAECRYANDLPVSLSELPMPEMDAGSPMVLSVPRNDSTMDFDTILWRAFFAASLG